MASLIEKGIRKVYRLLKALYAACLTGKDKTSPGCHSVTLLAQTRVEKAKVRKTCALAGSKRLIHLFNSCF